MKELVLTDTEYVLTLQIVKNMLHYYRGDLARYKALLLTKNYETKEEVDTNTTIVFSKEKLLEVIEFLTTDIVKVEQLLVTLEG